MISKFMSKVTTAVNPRTVKIIIIKMVNFVTKYLVGNDFLVTEFLKDLPILVCLPVLVTIPMA